jgi:hypothetical protein
MMREPTRQLLEPVAPSMVEDRVLARQLTQNSASSELNCEKRLGENFLATPRPKARHSAERIIGMKDFSTE